MRPVAVPLCGCITLYCLSSTNSVNGARGSVGAFKPGRVAFGILRVHESENTPIIVMAIGESQGQLRFRAAFSQRKPASTLSRSV